MHVGYRQKAEMIFLRYGVKYQKVWKSLLILNPERNERRKHKVINAFGPIGTIYIDVIDGFSRKVIWSLLRYQASTH